MHRAAVFLISSDYGGYVTPGEDDATPYAVGGSQWRVCFAVLEYPVGVY